MPENSRARAAVVAAVLSLIVGLFSVDYTVVRGDTLSQIAKEHGVDLTDVIAANDLANPDLIFPGQVIVIPEKDIIHVVARGETLTGIAAAYGTTARNLAEANAIENPNLIRIGQEIVVSGSPRSGARGDGGSRQDSDSDNTATRSGNYHIVKTGDTVESIAKKYGVTASAIRTANGIVGDSIYTGTRLFLDGPGFVAAGSAGTATYTIQRGDRLGDIASRLGTSVSRLVEMNGLSNPNVIRSGQVIKVPGKASWVCPLEKASFFNDWGFPRSGGRYHEGNDLFAGRGTPVRAPVAGTVEFVVGPVGGNQFLLDGVDGVRYLGSHMDSFEGKSRKVAAGEVLGYVGNSGNAQGTSPHVHFSIYLDGKAVNPYPTLLQFGCKG